MSLESYCRAVARICRFFLLPILAAWLIAGCGSDDRHLVGDWRGEFKSGTQSIAGADLHLSEDHRFHEVYQNYNMEGSWRRSGSIVTLTPETINGETVAEVQRRVEERGTPQQKAMTKNFADPVDMTLAKDGKTLTTDTVAGGRTIYTKS